MSVKTLALLAPSRVLDIFSDYSLLAERMGAPTCKSSQSLVATRKLPHSTPRAYNPVDYDHLNVSPEIKDLFQYIGRYKPQEVELETTLRCFVPDFIPAVGEMDAFVKVPSPDGQPDDLGLKVSTGFKFIHTPS